MYALQALAVVGQFSGVKCLMKKGRTCRLIHTLTSASVLQRNLKVAQTLAREAENKRADAVRLALEFEAAKNAAKEAGQVSLTKLRCSYGVHTAMHSSCRAGSQCCRGCVRESCSSCRLV